MFEIGNDSKSLGEASVDAPQFNFGIFNQAQVKPLTFEEVQTDAHNCLQRIEEEVQEEGFFIVKPANRWIEEAKLRPIPKMLFGEFWFEGELCFLFADTNLGKSILAVQIGNSISKGKPIEGLKLEAPPQGVLYFDFELSLKQFEARYSNEYHDHYHFADNFQRAEINPDNLMSGDTTDYETRLNLSLEKAIIETGAKILIVDNLTYLRNETEKAKDASPLMKLLKVLKEKYGLSMLVLAHTPKRDLSKAISRNDLQGSKMLINFCDSAFAIGESFKDNQLRYLKQIKARNTNMIYDSENVCLGQIEKAGNFLSFAFNGFGTEREHLKIPSDKDRAELKERVKSMAAEGNTQRQIANELRISVGTVNNYLNK